MSIEDMGEIKLMISLLEYLSPSQRYFSYLVSLLLSNRHYSCKIFFSPLITSCLVHWEPLDQLDFTHTKKKNRNEKSLINSLISSGISQIHQHQE